MPEQTTTAQPVEDQVEIITSDGARGRVSSATARHLITYNGARLAEPPATVPDSPDEDPDVEDAPAPDAPAPDVPEQDAPAAGTEDGWADDGGAAA